MNGTVKITLLVVAAIISIILVLAYSEKRMDQVMKSVDTYEACVAREYNTSPSAWYQQHGSYPECK